jgi:hypothetical protein
MLYLEAKVDPFLDRHADKILGTVSCLDRVQIFGSLLALNHKEAMTSYLMQHHIALFDYPNWAKTYAVQIRNKAEAMAQQAGIEIQFLRKHDQRKEELIHKIMEPRGDHPGLVAILSAMESCITYRPQRDRNSGKRYLKTDMGKCLHYYFHFIDAQLGHVYLRVPTWAPFSLQFYFNGHSVLERRLRQEKVDYTMLDNSFARLGDYERAQQLADDLVDPRLLHQSLDAYATLCCPPASALDERGYHWSLSQVEYSTDIIFVNQQALAPLYDELIRTAMLGIRAEQVAMFLGRKLDPKFAQELGSQFALRVEGRRLRHQMGQASLKMYDKFGLLLRIETTTNDVSFFKHHRRVEHRDGSWEMKTAAMRKTIYNLPELSTMMAACNRRYLDWLGAIEDPTARLKELDRLSRPERDEQNRSARGFNLFAQSDRKLFEQLLSGEFCLSGLRNRDLQERLGKSSHQISHLIKGLRLHGMLKKIGHTYKYYLTDLGKRVMAAGLRLRQTVIIPALSPQTVGKV